MVQEEIDEEEDQLTHEPVYMNLFMVTKYQRTGKLSSHNWFFNGFCQELDPKYSFLLDVGMIVEETGIVKMYNYMVNKPSVGGVCGYTGLRVEKV